MGTNSLIHSLIPTKIETVEVVDQVEDIKMENQDEFDVKITLEPVGSSHPNAVLKMEEKHIFKQENASDAEYEEKSVSALEMSTASNESELSTTSERRDQQLLIEFDTGYFVCNNCGKVCDTKAILRKHIQVHKPTISKQTNVFITQTSLHNEKITNVSSKDLNTAFQCPHCNNSFSGHTSLKRHIRTHTGEKPYNCQYCSYKCASSDDLKKHIRTHTGERPFKCPHCNYTCAQNKELGTHIRTHTGEKPYECNYCSYRSRHNSHLHRHIRTHTGEKPYKCSYCNYTCNISGSLKLHLRTHTGEKPFKCQYCSYKSTHISHLKRHIKTHTGEKPFK